MTLRKLTVVGATWIVTMLMAGLWSHAQTPLPPPAQRFPPTTQPPTVISGNELGFRIENWKGSTPVGTLVVKVNGQWVAVDEPVGVKRLTAR